MRSNQQHHNNNGNKFAGLALALIAVMFMLTIMSSARTVDAIEVQLGFNSIGEDFARAATQLVSLMGEYLGTDTGSLISLMTNSSLMGERSAAQVTEALNQMAQAMNALSASMNSIANGYIIILSILGVMIALALFTPKVEFSDDYSLWDRISFVLNNLTVISLTYILVSAVFLLALIITNAIDKLNLRLGATSKPIFFVLILFFVLSWFVVLLNSIIAAVRRSPTVEVRGIRHRGYETIQTQT